MSRSRLVATKAVLAVGQALREMIHVRRFQAATRQPQQAQLQKLLSIVRSNRDTVFGKAHRFDSIRSVADFQRNVPVCSYEDLGPYIEAIMKGRRAQLTQEQPFMFATTSGTTTKPKFIPITETHLRDYTHAFQIQNYQLIRDYPHGAEGRFLILTSNDEEGRSPGGIPYGAVSGVLNRRQPAVIRRHFAVPYELGKISDVETKYYLMLRMAASQNVTAILCCNPSSLLLLTDQLLERGETLVRDMYDGRVDPDHKPPQALNDAFQPYLRACPQRARELAQIMAGPGRLLPRYIWPNLAVISCWKGGPMSFYLAKLPGSYGDVPVRDFGYMASEGRGSIPLSNDGAGGVLAITSHFFEFLPEEELDSLSPSYLTADELEVGRRYYIYFTTAAGLYRYNINDLIEVTEYYENTPVIQFVRKGAGVSSITGEKLTEDQVRVALCQAVERLGLTELKHFTAAVQLDDPPYYTCFAETSGHLSARLGEEFIELFEGSLQRQNREYHEKRSTKRLGPPVLRLVPSGTYTRLRQERVLEGAPEAQVKIPLLAGLDGFGDKLAALASLAAGSARKGG